MGTRVLLAFVALSIGTAALADLSCSNLTITAGSLNYNCSLCSQWVFGSVQKTGSASGPLCLFVCSTHSFNVCEPSILLWIGTDYDTMCYESVKPTDTSIYWQLESSRNNWHDSRGSKAEIYIGVPCFNCSSKKVTVTWTGTCPYCGSCQ